MRRSAVAALVMCAYRIPAARRITRAVVLRLEGGEMNSVSLRRIMSRFHGVSVGPYSYGSLLRPGMGQGPMEIGSYCSIGPNVRRYAVDHPMHQVSTHPYFCRARYGFVAEDTVAPASELVIGDEVWIGANVVILSQVTSIGSGAVIGAGTIVSRNVPPFAVVVGNPSRVVAHRVPDRSVERLLTEAPWRNNPDRYVSRATELLVFPD